MGAMFLFIVYTMNDVFNFKHFKFVGLSLNAISNESSWTSLRSSTNSTRLCFSKYWNFCATISKFTLGKHALRQRKNFLPATVISPWKKLPINFTKSFFASTFSGACCRWWFAPLRCRRDILTRATKFQYCYCCCCPVDWERLCVAC